MIYQLQLGVIPGAGPGFFIGGGARPKGRRPRAGWGFWGGVATPSPPDKGPGERCELPSGVRGGASTAQRFSTIFNTQGGLS